MGEIILNGRSYNSGTKYLEVTQAQYNALPTSKLTDGTLYCITDAPGPGEGFPPMIYSYEEREVGVWVDGKPLYQKTCKIGSMVKDSSWHSVNHNIANIDNIVNSFGMLWDTASSGVRYPINIYRPDNTYGVVVQCNRTSFNYINNWLSDVADSYITIQYTKTTDVAGAGTWLPDGTQAHHYSTDEHIIGTWIDGKPLYEKTFNIGNISAATSSTVLIAKNDIDANCFVRRISGNIGSMQLNHTNVDANYYNCVWGIGPIYYMAKWGSDVMSNSVITVQYTKTTN